MPCGDRLQQTQLIIFFAMQEVNSILVDQTFTGEAMHGWTTDVCAAVMGRLTELKKPFKFVGTACCVVPERGRRRNQKPSRYLDHDRLPAQQLARFYNAKALVSVAIASVCGMQRWMVGVLRAIFAAAAMNAMYAGSVTVRWENSSMYAIVTVYALSV